VHNPVDVCCIAHLILMHTTVLKCLQVVHDIEHRLESEKGLLVFAYIVFTPTTSSDTYDMSNAVCFNRDLRYRILLIRR
jgi:hypothetical protein